MGASSVNDFYRFGRMAADGAWDASFALPGVSVRRLDTFQANSARVLILQDDGSILLGDDSFMVGGLRRNGLLRFVDRAAPVITTQPTNHTRFESEPVSFSVGLTSPTQVRFQWQKNGADIAGATAGTLYLPAVSLLDVGAYSVAVTNANGTVQSLAGSLLVAPAVAPTISVQPRMRAVAAGETAAFSVAASGSPRNTRWTSAIPPGWF